MPPQAQASYSSLHDGSDTAQADRSRNLAALRAARSLESLGTTAKREEWQRNSAWCQDLQYVWKNRTAPALAHLEARARALRYAALSTSKSQERYFDATSERWRVRWVDHEHPMCPLTAMEVVRLQRSAEWHEERARALAMERTDVVDTCRTRWRTTKCECGPREVQVGCDNPWLCEWCRKRHWRRWRKKITRSMDAHVRGARSTWARWGKQGLAPGVYLITLTGPHSGDIATDRAVMGRALRGLLKYAHARGWWSTYALTWEVTPGTDAAGHVHVHLAVVSQWIPYTTSKGDAFGPREPGRAMYWVRKRYQRTPTMGLHEAWRHYMPGAEILDVQAPNRYRKKGQTPASYLSKYVTKGVEPSKMTGAKAGEMLVAFRNRRKLSTSRHFWLPEDFRCRTCGCYHRMVETPCSLQDIAPGAVLRSQVARHKWLGIQEAFHWFADPGSG